jgi:hypothetical protein
MLILFEVCTAEGGNRKTRDGCARQSNQPWTRIRLAILKGVKGGSRLAASFERHYLRLKTATTAVRI